MTPFLKSLLGIGLAGGGAGLSVGGYYLFKSPEPKTLSEKLTRANLRILDLSSNSSGSGSTEGDVWTQKLNTYNGNDHASKRFPGLPSSGGANPTKQELINECKKYLETSPKEISKTTGLEEKVKFWCTSES